MDFEVSSKNGNGYIALGFNPSNQMVSFSSLKYFMQENR